MSVPELILEERLSKVKSENIAKEIISKRDNRSWLRKGVDYLSRSILLPAAATLAIALPSCETGEVNSQYNGCKFDSQCASGEICDNNTKQCVPKDKELESCIMDTDCPEDFDCNPDKVCSNVPDTTKILGSAVSELESITGDQKKLTFKGSSTYANKLKPGDIIVAGISNKLEEGLLREVTSISNSGSNISVQTVSASLEQAIKKGIISGTIVFSEDYLGKADAITPGVTIETTYFPLSEEMSMEINFDHVNLYKNVLFLDGSLEGNISANFEVEIDWFKIKEVYFALGGEENLDLTLSGEISKTISEQLPPIKPLHFPPIAFAIPTVPPIPVVISPELSIILGVDASGELSFETGINQSIEMLYGLQYKNKEWQPIKSFAHNFDTTGVNLTQTHADIRAYVIPLFALDFYGVAGPYGAVEAFVGAEVEPFNNPWCSVYAGLDIMAGVHVEALGKTLADYHTTIFELEKELYTCEESNTCIPSQEICDGKDNDCDNNVDEGNVCGSTCQDECYNVGQTECVNSSSFKECGNYDEDSCLELSSTQYCGNEEICENGECVEESTGTDYTVDELFQLCSDWRDLHKECYGEYPALMSMLCSELSEEVKESGNIPKDWLCAKNATCTKYIECHEN